MNVKPLNRATVTDQVLEQLGTLIRTGELQPGQKLPNERDLAEMFGTTRARIREALRALALIGLIETRPGDGSYVTENHDIPNEAIKLMFYKESRMFDELYAVRRLIEPPIFYLALEHIENVHIEKLEHILSRCKEVIETAGDSKEFHTLINQYDEVIVGAVNNSVLTKLISVFLNIKDRANLTLYQVPNAMENSFHHRLKIVQALKKRDMEELRIAVEEHFDSAVLYYSDLVDDEFMDD
ncbi:FadR family transcriptional regulator [Alicyclobacillus fastidiosus]|uniref:FadR family transcriptional regulator n=1 Tax=Alicyclobacillus fastidiosus TaxID=392011 RepID=A0ABY6ZNI6_9BACL|nr:FadR/GntR family transcriptional regulator [Alicyclobacillus fastidiosus]WAH44409.1 FadR family transcriptional regulator [Alicyclobacillus fastidiosus]GMA60749.1 GntR family transcriptional regulator [Alicyclobacillus fastidiosus]